MDKPGHFFVLSAPPWTHDHIFVNSYAPTLQFAPKSVAGFDGLSLYPASTPVDGWMPVAGQKRANLKLCVSRIGHTSLKQYITFHQLDFQNLNYSQF